MTKQSISGRIPRATHKVIEELINNSTKYNSKTDVIVEAINDFLNKMKGEPPELTTSARVDALEKEMDQIKLKLKIN